MINKSNAEQNFSQGLLKADKKEYQMIKIKLENKFAKLS